MLTVLFLNKLFILQKRLLEKAQQQEQQVALSSTSLQPFLGEASELRLINENLKQHVQALTHACEVKSFIIIKVKIQ